MSSIQHLTPLSSVSSRNIVSVRAGDIDYPSRFIYEIYWGPISDYLRDTKAFDYRPSASSSDLADESSRGGLDANEDSSAVHNDDESRFLSIIMQALKAFGKLVNRIGRMNFFGSTAWL